MAAHYREQSVSAVLAPWVECVWNLESRTPLLGHRVPPDGCLDIIYDRASGLRVIGAMTREQRFDYPDGAAIAGIRFHPGMAGRFLPLSARELTDGSILLEDLWPHRARELGRQLDDECSIEEASEILARSLRVPDTTHDPVEHAIAAMTAARGNVDLDWIARQANLSARQFRRRCLEESGLTPKLLCRILRFRYASHLAHAAKPRNWAAVALEARYFDQAHFIRDFRQFTGVPPMSVFSKT